MVKMDTEVYLARMLEDATKVKEILEVALAELNKKETQIAQLKARVTELLKDGTD